MLHTLDILIGVSFVMLVTSMVVMLITECLSTVSALRQRKLAEGLSDLLSLLDNNLSPQDRISTVNEILEHPSIRQRQRGLSSLFTGGIRGSGIHRHEFIRLLLHVAGKNGANPKLVQTVKANGVLDPELLLADIRRRSAEMELSSPDLPAHTRQDMAILAAAPSDLVYKIHDWFDQIIERVIDRFKQTTRIWSFVAALIVAFLLSVDLIHVIDVLDKDQKVLDATVALAQKYGVPPSDVASVAGQLRALPRPLFKPDNPNPFGILLSALLMSLGAPFWYRALSKLIDLRSRVNAKDDEQRAERQTQSSTSTGNLPPAATSPARPPLGPPRPGTLRVGPNVARG